MRDTAIESSVVTKVKGFGRYANRVMDVSDYVTPPQVWSPYPRATCGCPVMGQCKEHVDGIPKPVVSVISETPPQRPGGGLPSRVQH